MLSLHTKRKHVLATLFSLAIILPVMVFAVQKILIVNGVFADTMPAGFNDQVFYDAVLDEFKTEFPDESVADTGLTDEQLAKISNLRYSGVGGTKISDTTGLEKMTGLTSLDLQWNNISSIDLSGNTAITSLNLEQNQLSEIDLSDLTQATSINVANNSLTSLDLSANTALVDLRAGKNQLTTIDLSNNMALATIHLNNNALESLDVSGRASLTSLEVTNNSLVTLDVSNDPALVTLDVGFNQISSLNTTNDTSLSTIKLVSNQISSLDLSTNTNLSYLDVDINPISSIDLSHNSKLKTFRAVSDFFTTLDFSNNPLLETLYVPNNQLTSIDLMTNVNLKNFEIYENQLTSLDLSNNTLLRTVIVYDNQLTSLTLPNNTSITQIDVHENQLTSLDVSQYTALTKLVAYNNNLNSLEVANNTALKTLETQQNNLSQMDISNNSALTSFKADNIPVKMDIELLDEQGSGFSLANLAFLKTTQSISNTDNYEYNSGTKALTITNPDTYSATAQISSNQAGLTYQIKLPMVLRYDAGEGSGAPESEVCYPESASEGCTINISSTEPTREKYEFLGWATSADATTADYQAGGSITVQEVWTKTLYAVWSPIHKLTYDVNGGVGEYAEQTCYNDEDAAGTCELTINAVEPTYENHVFLGWATSATATTGEYQAGDTIVMSDNVTLTAMWGVRYTLNYDTDGGSGSYGEQSCQADNAIDTTCNITISNIAPTNGTYKYFLGWATSNTATTGQYQPGEVISMDDNKIIYARWTIRHFLNYEMNGANETFDTQFCVGDDINSVSCTVEVNNNTPTKTNSVFKNWSTDAAAEAGDIAPGTIISLDNDSTNIYAIWHVQYRLGYNLDGGTGTFESITCEGETVSATTCNATISENTPEKDGYYFLGWATNSGATTAEYQPGEAIVLDRNTTLYARWAVKFDLNYNVNGGTGSYEAISCHGEDTTATSCDIEISPIAPTYEKHVFLGWSESATATTGQYPAGSTITLSQNSTIFAMWGVRYTLNYNTEGGTGSYNEQSCEADNTIATTCVIRVSYIKPTYGEYKYFLGWAENATATTGQYQPGDDITMNEDKTLHARWTIKHYLNYDMRGAEEQYAQQFCVGENTESSSCAVEVNSTNPTKTKRLFTNWTLDSEATEGSILAGQALTLENDSTTIYATWIKKYTVSYIVDGVTTVTDCTAPDSDDDICKFTITMEAPTVEGKILTGWATDESAELGEYQTGDEIDVTEDTNLYPIYVPFFMIEFDVNGGEGEFEAIECVAEGASSTECIATLPEEVPELTGYIFKGWALTADATEAEYEAGDEISVSEDTLLYAVWEVEPEEDPEFIPVPNTGSNGHEVPTGNYVLASSIGLTTIAILTINAYIVKRLVNKKEQ